MLTSVEEDELPSKASSNFLFFLGPVAASAVELAARFRISYSCCFCNWSIRISKLQFTNER